MFSETIKAGILATPARTGGIKTLEEPSQNSKKHIFPSSKPDKFAISLCESTILPSELTF